MKKIFLLITLLFLFSASAFSEIKIKVYKNMTFEKINSRSSGRYLVGVGILEITCDSEDLRKIIRLDFLNRGYITNKKNWIEIKKLYVEDKDKIFLLKNKVKHIKFYGIINKNNIGKNIKDGDLIEGKYIGATPIIMSIYGKGAEKK